MRIAILGMGQMGRAVALRLLTQGHQVWVWNRTPGRATEVIDAGATESESVTAAAAHAEAVLLSLADDNAVTNVLDTLFTDGSRARDWPRILIDASTVAPATSRTTHGQVPGGRMVAAPIVGAPKAVQAGRAEGLLGGQRELLDQLDPIWSALFTTRLYCGDDPADATTYKLLNNYLLIAGIATLAEAVALGQQAGLDNAQLRNFLASPAVAPALHNRVDDIISGDHKGWFTTTLGAKDVRLITELGTSLGLDLPLAALVARQFAEVADAGWARSDLGAVIELLRRPTAHKPAASEHISRPTIATQEG